MGSGAIASAIQRQKDRPDIHYKVPKPKPGGAGGTAGYGEDVFEMVRDLKSHVPELSQRQLSTLVGIATFQVRKALDNSVPDERWTSDDNEASAAAELSALKATGCSGYTDDPRAETEYSGLPVFISPPVFRDRYRRADQSHTIPRPITLATTPFNIAT